MLLKEFIRLQGEEMLEVKNLNKIYKTVKGVKQQALNNVNLKFEETGMVFILGKSGSGKSTLLNLLGGLDKYDSGEIIIKGKSSSAFKNKDFDSYRNTYLGFIFQEFYIIEDFTVEQNIGLALKLQHKKADKKSIDDILAKVDLSGYAQRKPNELSGGQKQRVAIARALIKNPQIIMADEPTGSLDSNTGKQMFDTLKKLSKEKLVLIVSHDRESAENYGDRVIELSDGVVISDIKRVNSKDATGFVKTESYEHLYGSYIHIKKGKALNKDDIQEISKALLENEGEIFINLDNKSSQQLYKSCKKHSDNHGSTFVNTEDAENSYKEYQKEDFKLIKSKLPFKEAFKIGASGLKRKKIRLGFTILLSVIAFVLFGVADAVSSYKNAQALLKTMNESDLTRVGISSYIPEETPYGYVNKTPASFNEEKVTAFTETFKSYNFEKAYSYNYASDIRNKIAAPTDQAESNDFYNKLNNNYYGAFFNSHNNRKLLATDFTGIESNFITINSKKPEAINEIIITEYLAGLLLDFNLLNVDTFEEIINKTLTIMDKELKITGIVDIGLKNIENIDSFKSNQNYDYQKVMQFQNIILTNEMLYVSQEFIDTLDLHFFDTSNSQLEIFYNNNYHYNIIFKPISNATNSDINFKTNKTLENFGDADVILSFLPIYYANTIIYNQVSSFNREILIDKKLREDFNAQYEGEIDDVNYNYEYNLFRQNHNDEYFETNTHLEEIFADFLETNWVDIEDYFFNDIDFSKKFNITSRNYDDDLDLSLSIAGSKKMNLDDIKESMLNYYNNEHINDQKTVIYISENVFEDISGNVKSYEPLLLYFELSGNYANDLSLLDYLNNSNCMHVTPFSNDLQNIDYLAKTLSEVFLYASIAFCVFAGLLLLNFISISVANKKKEIGILRALGSRQIDVFSIFTIEGMLIAAIELFIAIIGALILTNLLNNLISENLTSLMGIETTFTLFFFTLRQVALMIVLAVGVVLLASFIPVKKIASMKPIDAIKDK